uniref:Glycoprotein vOX2-4 n=2 Tax=Elephantid herpesvirus 1 TaxID=146015 RepID=A0A386AUG5_ELHV1|nr:glycoprotein vOX2-4 [Elephant endotheliotropic herpesvirus 1B]AYC62802.1 glycoprotein vOX2-4 [Elephant endotheliotropic herpesvirus 1A]
MCFYGPYVETKNQSAILNTNVTLECSLVNSNDSISAIIWYKNDTHHKVAVANKDKSSAWPVSWLSESNYQDKVKVTQDQMKTSNLTIVKTTKNDSCCFICKFQCGSSSNCSDFSNTTCLTVYASVETNISSSSDRHGKLNVTCLARALPPASNVTWIGLSNIDNSTSITNNTDGTLTVRSTLYVTDDKRQINGSAYCKVSHQVSVTYLAAPWNSADDLGIFDLIIKELDLSDDFELVFNDGEGDDEDDDYDDDEGEDDEDK